MTYGFLIAINIAAFFIGNPVGVVNIACAGFLAGLWLAEVVNRKIEV